MSIGKYDDLLGGMCDMWANNMWGNHDIAKQVSVDVTDLTDDEVEALGELVEEFTHHAIKEIIGSRPKKKTEVCDCCGEVFVVADDSLSEEDKQQEYEDLFGKPYEHLRTSLVCEECYLGLLHKREKELAQEFDKVCDREDEIHAEWRRTVEAIGRLV